MSLRRIIVDRIRSEGPLRFSDYMAMALYHPESGYYASGANRIGCSGDFITSVSVGSVFGELMGSEFCSVWESLERPGSFTLVEQGANDGRFAMDVLEWAARERPDFFAALRVRLREPFAALRTAQASTLCKFTDRISWSTEPVECGVFFANELLDALPVNRWIRRGDAWRELRVALSDDGESFCEVETIPPGALPAELANESFADHPDGFQTETCPGLADCVTQAVQSIGRGAIFFADYGLPAEELRVPHRSAGSLRGYRNHRREDDPFAAPGETDLTTHVDWTAVERATEAAGANVRELTDQGRFLTRLALPKLAGMEGSPPDSHAAKWLRQFRTLTHPAHLGRVFQILAATKVTPAS